MATHKQSAPSDPPPHSQSYNEFLPRNFFGDSSQAYGHSIGRLSLVFGLLAFLPQYPQNTQQSFKQKTPSCYHHLLSRYTSCSERKSPLPSGTCRAFTSSIVTQVSAAKHHRITISIRFVASENDIRDPIMFLGTPPAAGSKWWTQPDVIEILMNEPLNTNLYQNPRDKDGLQGATDHPAGNTSDPINVAPSAYQNELFRLALLSQAFLNPDEVDHRASSHVNVWNLFSMPTNQDGCNPGMSIPTFGDHIPLFQAHRIQPVPLQDFSSWEHTSPLDPGFRLDVRPRSQDHVVKESISVTNRKHENHSHRIPHATETSTAQTSSTATRQPHLKELRSLPASSSATCATYGDADVSGGNSIFGNQYNQTIHHHQIRASTKRSSARYVSAKAKTKREGHIRKTGSTRIVYRRETRMTFTWPLLERVMLFIVLFLLCFHLKP